MKIRDSINGIVNNSNNPVIILEFEFLKKPVKANIKYAPANRVK